MLAVLVGSTIWRYRYDQFGWTTRSSQLYESRLLRIGSPLFHFGILVQVAPLFVVGTGVSYSCSRDGALVLGINDIGVANNSGECTATITRTHTG